MTRNAETVFKSLNGVMCAYKPSGASCDYVRIRILSSLCSDLNNLETRAPRKYLNIQENGDDVSLTWRPSYADNVLCVGPRYQPQDFTAYFTSFLGRRSSGIVVLGINRGKMISDLINKSFFTKCFHVRGLLGQATSNFFTDSKVIANSKYSHVTRYHIEKILSSYQAANQRRMFEELKIKPDSQEAYEVAVSRLYRPQNKETQVIYSLKCIEFQPPNITIEVNGINLKEITLLNLIHNIGLSLKSLATCVGLRCIRYGCFNLEHALLKKHWDLENIEQNMKICFNTLEQSFPDKLGYSRNLKAFQQQSICGNIT